MRWRGKDGSESPGFSAANAGLFGTNVLLASQSASGAIQFHRAGAEKGDSGLDRSGFRGAEKMLLR
jgi:hypothetical protein